jgi:signal transduction histidine kinase
VRLETEIVERRRTEEIIRHALEKEKELGELQSRIITTISHEFRTPLTTILASTELLKITAEMARREKAETFPAN